MSYSVRRVVRHQPTDRTLGTTSMTLLGMCAQNAVTPTKISAYNMVKRAGLSHNFRTAWLNALVVAKYLKKSVQGGSVYYALTAAGARYVLSHGKTVKTISKKTVTLMKTIAAG